MKLVKKLVILTGRGSARGTVAFEKNAFGIQCRANLHNLRDIIYEDYILFVISANNVHAFDMGKKGTATRQFSLSFDTDLSSLHVCVCVGEHIALYGTTEKERMWESNLQDIIRRSGIESKTAASAETNAAETPPQVEYSTREKDINGYFLDIMAGADYRDDAIAEVNYYQADFKKEPKPPAPAPADGLQKPLKASDTFVRVYEDTPEKANVADAGTSFLQGPQTAEEAPPGPEDAAAPKTMLPEDLRQTQEPLPVTPAEPLPDNDNRYEQIGPEDIQYDTQTGPKTDRKVLPPIEYSIREHMDEDPGAVVTAPGMSDTEHRRQRTEHTQEFANERISPLSYYESLLEEREQKPGGQTAQPPDVRQREKAQAAADCKKETPPETAVINKLKQPVPPAESLKTKPPILSEVAAAAVKAAPPLEVPHSRIRIGTFYEQLGDQLEELFKTYERAEELEKLIPESKWIKVDYEASGKYYVIGLIGKPDYICYGVPAIYTAEPPPELDGYCQWLPLDVTNPARHGYWLLFQDAVTGESVKNEII